MNAQHIEQMLPVIIAFAYGVPIQHRSSNPGSLHKDLWLSVNPETTEFRLTDDTNPDDWRVHPEAEIGNLLVDVQALMVKAKRPGQFVPYGPLSAGDVIGGANGETLQVVAHGTAGEGIDKPVRNWQAVSKLLIDLQTLDPTINADEELTAVIERSIHGSLSVEEELRVKVEAVRKLQQGIDVSDEINLIALEVQYLCPIMSLDEVLAQAMEEARKFDSSVIECLRVRKDELKRGQSR